MKKIKIQDLKSFQTDKESYSYNLSGGMTVAYSVYADQSQSGDSSTAYDSSQDHDSSMTSDESGSFDTQPYA